MAELLHKVRRRMTGAARSLGYAARACSRRVRRQRGRILLAAHFDPRGLGNMRENAESIVRHSRHRFDLLNLCGLRLGRGIRIPRYVRLADYDGLLVHSSLPYLPETIRGIDGGRRERIADFGGVKILMKQDEHARVNSLVEWLRDARFDLLVTCVPAEEVRKVYPASELPNLRFLHVRTGYVTPEMRRYPYAHDAPRPIDVGYRGTTAPFVFGRLCYEKREIGERFRRLCAERGLAADISSRPEDRVYGRRWLDFLGRSKATLGVESGASVFDFTGELEQRCEQYLREHPQADFETVHRLILAPHEGNVDYRQISPRHFEAAACRTVQILYEGRYSGVFQADRHYLSLARDGGNVDEVLARLLDPAERKRLTEAAFEEIILNDDYLDAAFVDALDRAIDSLL